MLWNTLHYHALTARNHVPEFIQITFVILTFDVILDVTGKPFDSLKCPSNCRTLIVYRDQSVHRLHMSLVAALVQFHQFPEDVVDLMIHDLKAIMQVCKLLLLRLDVLGQLIRDRFGKVVCAGGVWLFIVTAIRPFSLLGIFLMFCLRLPFLLLLFAKS
jgi:hypothetical protein